MGFLPIPLTPSPDSVEFMSHFGSPFDNIKIEDSGVDPANLTMSGNNYGMSQSFGMGAGAIGDDELESLIDTDNFNNYNGSAFGGNFSNDQSNFYGQNTSGPQQQNMSNQQMFSHTPNDAPIRSPFTNNDFNYNQYSQPQQQQQFGGSSMPMMTGAQRKAFERQVSDSRSPMTPRIQGLHIGTPDSISQQAMLNQQAKNASNQWNGTPGSGSWIESPLASPHPHHLQQISEVMAGKHASVPAKLEGAHSASLPSFQSQEAKKKRRRESHNLVERRRRDNINERIQDLSKLVPYHRLEDDKVRKHINANGPLSPSGVSPPQATSLLAGPNARRATPGTITQGLPQDDKEKGPNKGDILNGAVSWMRDCMWLLYLKEQQQQQLIAQLERMGGTWDHEPTDNESRMMSELRHAVERNGWDNFSYSRGNGTGLRVPEFTNWAGDALDGSKPDIMIKPDPANAESDLWFINDTEGRHSMSIKEEEEDLGMDMG